MEAMVIGGGPAGLAAATLLARHRRTVTVVDSGEYRNAAVDLSHGYLGSDGFDPAELRRRARADLSRYETVDFVTGRITSAEGQRDAFVATLDGGQRIEAQRVVLATGVVDATPDVERFSEFYGADVFHCPTCDGYEARGRVVVAFGWSAEVAGFARGLLTWAASVTVVTDGHRFEGDGADRASLAEAGIEVVEDNAAAFVGTRGDLRAVSLAGGRSLDCQLAFFSIAHHPRAGLAEQLGCAITSEGCIEVDEECQTTVPGVFAAGDVTPGVQLVQVAAAKGAVAGAMCAKSLIPLIEG